MDPVRLAPAPRSVLAGESVLPRWLVQKIATELRGRPGLVGSYRASEGRGTHAARGGILELMAEGLTTEQIAERLFVAKVTVRSHVSALLRKLRVPGRESAIRLSRGGRQQR